MSFGFSLFAIFSVLRYRTDPIPVREMTYLFVLMALPVIDAVLLSQDAYLALLIGNGITVLVLYSGEKEWGCRYDCRKSINYEKIDLIKPEKITVNDGVIHLVSSDDGFNAVGGVVSPRDCTNALGACCLAEGTKRFRIYPQNAPGARSGDRPQRISG